MREIAFFDTKIYDREFFNRFNNSRYVFRYLENSLNSKTANLANGCVGVIVSVNDDVNSDTIKNLFNLGIKVIAIRGSGYNNIDFKAAYKKINILRVPVYSPYAIAEHTMCLILSLNRKIHKAYNRTRDYNFSLNGLIGFDLFGKTIGVIGTGNIGKTFINIANGFGMKILAYDKNPKNLFQVDFVSKEELFKKSDIISLHCPLNSETKYIINKNAINMMKTGVFIINTSRGALINSKDLLEALQNGKVGAAGLDVYEEESEWFYEDQSENINQNTMLSLLISHPNVLVTSHQAFFTKEAMQTIAEITINNLDDYFLGNALKNEICYHCKDKSENICPKENGRCF